MSMTHAYPSCCADRRHGLTLVELLIALALGLMVMATIFAGFRSASQAVSVVNRLSQENALMRAGILAAFEETDWWRLADDPDGPANRQRLRSVDGGRGVPFADFTATGMTGVSDPGSDSDRGWNGDYEWPVSDPRTWQRLNLVEGTGSDRRFGHYEWVSAVDAPISPPGAGSIAPRHTWLPNQLAGLRRSLGWYGLIDHFPGAWVFGVYETAGYDGAARTSQRWARTDSNDGPGFFNAYDGALDIPNGIYHLTRDRVFPLYPATPWNGAGAWNDAVLVQRHHEARNVGRQVASSAELSAFIADAMVDKLQLSNWDDPGVAIKPESWPELRVGVMRYISHGKPTTMCSVRWSSPVTGEVTELTFTAPGTTLRGARRQRGLD